MPVNKHALIRYHVLDKCFSNVGRNYYIQDLLDACNEALQDNSPGTSGIQKRQLFEDIKFMESSKGWSIDLRRCRDGKRVHYRYADPRFSINNQTTLPLQSDELKSKLQILDSIRSVPRFRYVFDFLSRLNHILKGKANIRKYIAFEKRELKGFAYLNDLAAALVKKKVLKVTYKTYSFSTKKQMILHPCYLKEYNTRWYFLGKVHGFENIFSLALHRIVSFEQVDLPYSVPNIDFEAYFEHVMGANVRLTNKLTKITLCASPYLVHDILNNPIHHSQQVISLTKKGLVFYLELVPNIELEKKLLSFGENLTVIAPKKIKDRLENRVEKMVANYLGVQLPKVENIQAVDNKVYLT